MNAEQIKDRLKKLGIKIDLSNLQRLSDARNEIEHYLSQENKDIMGVAIVRAFPIIRNIIDELQYEPVELLGSQCWNSILADVKFYQTELSRCKTSFANIQWESNTLCRAHNQSEFSCTECGSPLLRQKNPQNDNAEEIKFICSHCGKEPERKKVIEAATAEVFAGEAYIAMTDGGEEPINDCPECGNCSYVMEENCCTVCGFSMKPQTCLVCAEPLTLDENGLDLCSYHAHVAGKE